MSELSSSYQIVVFVVVVVVAAVVGGGSGSAGSGNGCGDTVATSTTAVVGFVVRLLLICGITSLRHHVVPG